MMLIGYIKRLLSKHIFIAFFIIDSLTFLFLGRQLPWYAYPISLFVGLLIGSYLVYAEVKRELELSQETTPKLGLFFNTSGGPGKSIVATVFKPSDRPDFEPAINNKRRELINRWEEYEAPIIPKSDNLIIKLALAALAG